MLVPPYVNQDLDELLLLQLVDARVVMPNALANDGPALGFVDRYRRDVVPVRVRPAKEGARHGRLPRARRAERTADEVHNFACLKAPERSAGGLHVPHAIVARVPGELVRPAHRSNLVR